MVDSYLLPRLLISAARRFGWWINGTTTLCPQVVIWSMTSRPGDLTSTTTVQQPQDVGFLASFTDIHLGECGYDVPFRYRPLITVSSEIRSIPSQTGLFERFVSGEVPNLGLYTFSDELHRAIPCLYERAPNLYSILVCPGAIQRKRSQST